MAHCYIHKENAKFAYDDFVRDLRQVPDIPFVRYPQDYHGVETVNLCCTQHSEMVNFQEQITERQRKKITEEWVRFLSTEALPMKEVQLCTTTPQKVFDAICAQESVKSLRIKHLRCSDIGAIRKLRNLKKLFIESGPSIDDLSPLAELQNLEVLILGSTTKITDYSALGSLKKLNTLIVCSYQAREDRMIMESDAFLSDLVNLRYLDLQDVKILHRQFLDKDSAERFDYACFCV